MPWTSSCSSWTPPACTLPDEAAEALAAPTAALADVFGHQSGEGLLGAVVGEPSLIGRGLHLLLGDDASRKWPGVGL
jgi:hypothetical protein